MKKRLMVMAVLLSTIALSSCTKTNEGEVNATSSEQNVKETLSVAEPDLEKELVVAISSNYQNIFENDIKPVFQKAYPNINVEFVYGAVQDWRRMLDEGQKIDVIFPSTITDMSILCNEGYVSEDSLVPLLQNNLVLIAAENNSLNITTIEDIIKANTVAIANPDTVLVGKNAKEILESNGLWEQVSSKIASYATSEAEVLNWVSSGTAEVGIVYMSTASGLGRVSIISSFPDELGTYTNLSVGVETSAVGKEEVLTFMEFLKSDEANIIFSSKGFELVR